MHTALQVYTAHSQNHDREGQVHVLLERGVVVVQMRAGSVCAGFLFKVLWPESAGRLLTQLLYTVCSSSSATCLGGTQPRWTLT